ncbi:hypothetical protein STEG23_000927, partial [Scotinomys teguina]
MPSLEQSFPQHALLIISAISVPQYLCSPDGDFFHFRFFFYLKTKTKTNKIVQDFISYHMKK